MSEMAQKAAGVKILCGNLNIEEVVDVNPPTYAVEKNDSSSHDNIDCIQSASAGWISKTDGSFKINYIGTTAQDAIITDMLARTIRQWTFCHPQKSPRLAGRSYVFNGFVSGVKPSFPTKGNVQWDVTICPTDQIETVTTWATGLTTPFFAMVNDNSDALTPTETPAQSTYEYNVTCYANDISYNITPTATTGTIYVDGTAVATGVASGWLTPASNSGEAKYHTIVVVESGKTPKIYTIRVVVGWSDHA